MQENRRFSFVKYNEFYKQYEVNKKNGANNVLADIQNSYIYRGNILPKESYILNKDGNFLLDFNDNILGFNQKITLMARKNDVIRVNEFSEFNNPEKTYYISVNTMVNIINSKKYDIYLIADPTCCEDEIVYADIFAMNVMNKSYQTVVLN